MAQGDHFERANVHKRTVHSTVRTLESIMCNIMQCGGHPDSHGPDGRVRRPESNPGVGKRGPEVLPGRVFEAFPTRSRAAGDRALATVPVYKIDKAIPRPWGCRLDVERARRPSPYPPDGRRSTAYSTEN